jgi:hypothetical protein
MHRLKNNGGMVTEHAQKEHIVYEHFSMAMGRGPPSTFDLNWESLNLGNGALEEMEGRGGSGPRAARATARVLAHVV